MSRNEILLLALGIKRAEMLKKLNWGSWAQILVALVASSSTKAMRTSKSITAVYVADFIWIVERMFDASLQFILSMYLFRYPYWIPHFNLEIRQKVLVNEKQKLKSIFKQSISEIVKRGEDRKQS